MALNIEKMKDIQQHELSLLESYIEDMDSFEVTDARADIIANGLEQNVFNADKMNNIQNALAGSSSSVENYTKNFLNTKLTRWQSDIDGLNNIGTWVSSITYLKNNVIKYSVNGNYYICKQDCVAGTLPTNTTYWQYYYQGEDLDIDIVNLYTGQGSHVQNLSYRVYNTGATVYVQNQFGDQQYGMYKSLIDNNTDNPLNSSNWVPVLKKNLGYGLSIGDELPVDLQNGDYYGLVTIDGETDADYLVQQYYKENDTMKTVEYYCNNFDGNPTSNILNTNTNVFLRANYDLVIRTQADFANFINSLENNTNTAKSILFVGDGGNLIFNTSSTTLSIITGVLEITGINNAKIGLCNIMNVSSIKNITLGGEILYCNNIDNCGANMFEYCNYLTGCNAGFYFFECNYLKKCSAFSPQYEHSQFSYCNYLDGCFGGSFPYIKPIYSYCNNLVNCYTNAIDLSLVGQSTSIFNYCKNLNNCSFKPWGTLPTGKTLIGFSNCSYGSSCGIIDYGEIEYPGITISYNCTKWDALTCD